MASPIVTPAAPAAPAAPSTPPAPVTPPPSAPPAAPPAVPPPAQPAAPGEAAPPSPLAPDKTPSDIPAPPALPPYDPKTAPAPPKATDYSNTTDGQARFATDMNRWFKEHPEGEKPPVAAVPPPPADETPEQKALREAAPQPEAPKPAAPHEAAATPQALAEFLKDDAALNAAIEANPKAKGQIFKMARDLAEAAPIREIFPSVDDAKFAQEYSSNMVGLKTASLRLTSNPESAPQFLEMFDSQFAQVKADGTPVLDDKGQPVYDADRAAVRSAIFNSEISQFSSRFSTEIEGLKTKLGGNYPSDAARNADQKRLDNLEYATSALSVLDAIRDGSFFEDGPPELPENATEEQKAWLKGEQDKLARQRQELEDKQKGSNKEERAAATQKFQTGVRNDMGTSVGTVIGTALKGITDAGVYIPEFYMQEKYVDPTTGKETETSAIGARLFLAFENQLMKPGSRTLMDIAQHELLPQNDQTKEIRKAWYARQAAQIIPGLVQKEVDRIQDLVKLDQTKQEERLRKQREVASPEPSTGGSSLPQGASREQILGAAEEAAKKDPGWAAANPSERQARILTQVHRMQRK